MKIGTGSPSSWQYTADPSDPDTSGWVEGEHYVVFTNLTVSAGENLTIQLAGNSADNHVINGIQLEKDGGFASTLPNVAFSPTSGAEVPVNVSLSVPGESGCTIYYTTDGSTPTTMSSVYSSAINVTTASTIRAFASKSGFNDSAVSTASYVLPTAPAPSFDPVADHYTAPASVTISSTLSGASYKYRIDGGSWQDYTAAIEIGADSTLDAYTFKSGYNDSTTTSGGYTFTLEIPDSTVSPNGGSYTNGVSITLANTLSGTTLEYSTDGGLNWNTYTGAFTLDGIEDGTGWLLVKASKTYYPDTISASDQFTFTTASPTFSHASGTYGSAISVTLASGTTGASLEYGFDGLTWSSYSSSVSVTSSSTLYARASKAGYQTAGQIDYQAQAGFSEIQGDNNWTYQYSTSLKGSPASFLPMYDSSLAVWRLTNDLACAVGASYQHAGSANDSVRTFTVPFDGEVTVGGPAYLLDPDGGDGVEIRILHDTTTILDWTEVSTNGLPTTPSATFSVSEGDEIHFQASSGGDETGDLLDWNPVLIFSASRAYSINDTDGDGLTDSQESTLGTNASLADTDGDGVSDYIEYLQGRDPLVSGTVADTGGAVNLVVYTPLD